MQIAVCMCMQTGGGLHVNIDCISVSCLLWTFSGESLRRIGPSAHSRSAGQAQECSTPVCAVAKHHMSTISVLSVAAVLRGNYGQLVRCSFGTEGSACEGILVVHLHGLPSGSI